MIRKSKISKRILSLILTGFMLASSSNYAYAEPIDESGIEKSVESDEGDSKKDDASVDESEEEVIDGSESNKDKESTDKEEAVDDSEAEKAENEQDKDKKEKEELEEELEGEIITGFKKPSDITTKYKLALASLEEKFPTKVTAYIEGGKSTDGDETETADEKKTITIEVDEWKCLDDYDDEDKDEFQFEAIFETDYETVDDVEMPVLSYKIRDIEDGPTNEEDDFDLGYDVPIVGNPNSGEVLTAGESSYCNNYDAGKLPDIRNQGSEGACWAFSSLGAIEASMIQNVSGVNTDIDLSELQLAYYTSFQYDDPKDCHDADTVEFTNSDKTKYLSNGGNRTVAYKFLANMVGPVSEAQVPYTKGNSYVVPEKYAVSQDVAQITRAYVINSDDREGIKSAIRNYGGVAASFFATTGDFTNNKGDSFKVRYSATYNSFYGEVNSTNHAIVLVGYDDNFSKENFHADCKPEGDGAWLVRNSWGLEGYGKSGYFWLSYYDKGLAYAGNVTAYEAKTNVDDHIYAYDGYPTSSRLLSNGTNSISYSTDYYVDANESISAVGVETSNANANIKVDVTTNAITKSGTLDTTNSGYYYVPLSSTIDISTRTKVTVKVTITVDSGEVAKALLEDTGSDYLGEIKYTGVCSQGTDIGSQHKNYDTRVKLFTNDTNQTSTSEVKQTLNIGRIYDHKGVTKQLGFAPGSEQTDVSKFTWTSVDEDIATVSATGEVTVGSKKGKTNIHGEYTVGGRTYYADCEVQVKPYTISYVLDEDTDITNSPRTYYPGDADNCELPASYEIAKKYYTFGGWYTESAFENKVTEADLTSNYEGNLTLYPKWTPITVNVKYFKPNDDLTGYTDTKQSVITVDYEQLPIAVPNATDCQTNPNNCVSSYNSSHEEKKKFSYWSSDAAGNNSVTQITASMIENYSFSFLDSSNFYSCGYYGDVYLYPQYAAAGTSTVTFDANGGTVEETTRVVDDLGTYGTLPTPTRAKYHFDGWYTAKTGGTKVSSSTSVGGRGDHTLYAHWSVGQYRVYFDGNGSSSPSMAAQRINVDESVALSKNTYTRDHYTFDGWSTKYNGTGTKYADEQVVCNIAEVDSYTFLYAVWIPDEYTVSFDSQGGTAVSPITVKYGKTYGNLPSPTSAKQNFDGWYTQKEGGTRVTSSTSVTATSNHTLYAHWTAGTYTVAFNRNGGTSGSMTNQSFTMDISQNLKANTFVKSNYDFSCWNTEADGSGTSYTDGQSVSNLANAGQTLTLYAQWTPKQYTVTFHNEAADETYTKKVTYGQTYGEMPSPTRSGYDFAGWYKHASSTRVYETTTVNITADQDLYAHWTAKKLTVTFDSQGGSGVYSRTVTYASTYGTLSTPTRSGYTFDGWYTEKTGGSQVTSSTVVTKTENHTLYAHWTGTSVTVSFRNTGDSTVDPVTVVYEQPYGTLPTPTKTGYEFAGWYTSSNGGDKVEETTLVSTYRSHTLYAHWTGKSYTVSFQTGGGSDVSDKVVTYGQPYGTLSTPVKSQYDFAGWYTSAVGGTKITDTTTVSTSQNHTLYAHWVEESGVYYVQYDGNGATAGSMSNQQMNLGSNENLSANAFSKTDSSFTGWNTAADGSGDSYTDGQSVKNIADKDNTIVLYAQWIQTVFHYNIAFDGNGATSGTMSNQYMTIGSPEALSANQYAKTGYSFAGWNTDAAGAGTTYSDGQNVSDLAGANGTITLYAQWAEVIENYSIRFDGNGSTSGQMDAQTMRIGTSGVLSENVYIRDGYIFAGWNSRPDGDGTAYTDKQEVSDLGTKDATVVLYAQWTEIEQTDDLTDVSDIDPEDRAQYNAMADKTGIWIGGLYNKTFDYTGIAIKPEIRVYDANKKLTEKTDYTYTYKNNTNAGRGQVIVSGRGNYTGTYTKFFTINPLDIAAADFRCDNIAVTVSKSAQKPNPTLYWKDKKLGNKKDYTFTWKQSLEDAAEYGIVGVKEAGTYPVKIEGNGNFTGTRTINFKIATADKPLVSKATVKLEFDKHEYTGEQIKPVVTLVKIGKTELVENTDYVVTYGINKEVGTGTVTISAKEESGYAGVKTVNFKITGVALSKATVSGVPKSLEYNNEEYRPAVTLVYKSDKNTPERTLVENKDYTVSYSKNKNAGTATIELKGMGAFTGTVKKTFKINAHDMSSEMLNIVSFEWKDGISVFEYTKGGVKPKPVVKFRGQTLVENVDYKLSYSNNNALTATARSLPLVTVIGKGNFTGKMQPRYFTIVGQDISTTNMVVLDKVGGTKGGIYYSTPTLYDRTTGAKLSAGSDYEKTITYTYMNNGTVTRINKKVVEQVEVIGGVTQVNKADIIPIGTVIQVKVTGKGLYSGEKTGTYRITEKDVAKSTIKFVQTTGKNYTGKNIKFTKSELIVTIGSGKNLVQLADDDYEIVEYSNNVNRGTGKITIQGKGTYGGRKTVTFKINSKTMNYTVKYNAGNNPANTKTMKNSSTANGAKLSRFGFTAPEGKQFAGWKLVVQNGDGIEFTVNKPSEQPVLDLDMDVYKPGSVIEVVAIYKNK